MRQIAGLIRAPFHPGIPRSRTQTRRFSHAVSQRISGIAFFLSVFAVVLAAQPTPRRIVSTAPSITETLFALGIGDRVVGVSRFCNFPPEVQKLPKVGSYVKPDVEAIARLVPDLVILQQGQNDRDERFDALHIRFVEVPHDTLDDIYNEIRLIGDATGTADRSTRLIAQIRNSLEAIQSKAKRMPSPRVLVIVDRQQGTLNNLIAVGPNNYVNRILEIAGGINVLAQRGLPQYPNISVETVLRQNPDVIIDLSGTQETEEARRASRASTIALWRQYGDLVAVRSKHVYAGTTSSLVVPGPRTPIATQRLFDFVHGIGGRD